MHARYSADFAKQIADTSQCAVNHSQAHGFNESVQTFQTTMFSRARPKTWSGIEGRVLLLLLQECASHCVRRCRPASLLVTNTILGFLAIVTIV